MLGREVERNKIEPTDEAGTTAIVKKIIRGTPFKTKGKFFRWRGVEFSYGRNKYSCLALCIQDGRLWLFRPHHHNDGGINAARPVLLASVTLKDRQRVKKLRTAALEWVHKVYSDDVKATEEVAHRARVTLSKITMALEMTTR